MAIDALTYARRLEAAGMPRGQADGMAEATRDLPDDVATKADLATATRSLCTDDQ
jgi:hypothetical protein